ncbi:hypothetical protein HJG60_010003 [Phyllostomus discolor]|uniref:Uncharacterized protein n=1 Tax=Phyllostomus discolor TaxID=89673 RepID=A0A833YE65_9CHIR|nr:hypothetical protein HJG60_010003 [Phyllostomus discolor]
MRKYFSKQRSLNMVQVVQKHLQGTLPNNRKLLRRFLGIASDCLIWIPNFGLIPKPLYEVLKGPEYSHLECTKVCTQASESMKVHLASVLALVLPNLLKPFQLYVHERQGIAPGFLTQVLSNILQPITYFVKETRSHCPGVASLLESGSHL